MSTMQPHFSYVKTLFYSIEGHHKQALSQFKENSIAYEHSQWGL